MISANIQRLIGVAAPLWAGEAEVVRTYWTSPGRSLRTDLLWLQRQCFKEFWGSGVGKYDRGGVFLGQLRNLADKALEIDVSIDRHEILDVVEGLKAEFSHYCHFADLYDSIRPAGTPKMHPKGLDSWPEDDALTALRYRHQDEHGALGMRACKLSEGGYCTLFSEGMKLKGRPGVDGKIAEACAKVYDDEFEHMLGGIAGIVQEGLADADWRLMEKLIAEQLRHRIRMRKAQFSRPLPAARGTRAGDLSRRDPADRVRLPPRAARRLDQGIWILPAPGAPGTTIDDAAWRRSSCSSFTVRSIASFASGPNFSAASSSEPAPISKPIGSAPAGVSTCVSPT